MTESPGSRFKAALNAESPLQIVGTINAFCSLLAEHAGFKAIYLSGAGVANACFGLPDLGMTSLDNVTEEIRRITSATTLPLLVDADTGWGTVLNVAHTVQQMIKAGAAAMHLEDQIFAKRCGHRDGKALVPTETMVERIKAAVDARTEADFVIMARTDAYGVEGLSAAIERANTYVAAGADMIFAESFVDIAEYQTFTQAVSVPVLANLTEFGKTPLYTLDELRAVGIKMALYPLTAFRAMSKAALTTYETIRQEHTQKKLIPMLQTRQELYKILDYERYEKLLDNL